MLGVLAQIDVVIDGLRFLQEKNYQQNSFCLIIIEKFYRVIDYYYNARSLFCLTVFFRFSSFFPQVGIVGLGGLLTARV